MEARKENPIKVLFGFAGEAKGKMPLSIILAILGELFGMLPFLAAAMLANEVYAGAATLQSSLLWTGSAALGIAMRALLCTLSSARSHKIAFTILKNICRAIAGKMRRVPMGVMLETPSGVHKTLIVDNVGKLEDSIAHVIPGTIPDRGAACLPDPDFCARLAHGPCIPHHAAFEHPFYIWNAAGICSGITAFPSATECAKHPWNIFLSRDSAASRLC